jgi:hypothetical protein
MRRFVLACEVPTRATKFDAPLGVRLGYVPTLGTALEDRMQRILATLYRLSFPRGTAR